VILIAPVAVYTSGKGSSASGLTAAIVRDPSTKEEVASSKGKRITAKNDLMMMLCQFHLVLKRLVV